jgi:hypothetical protein
MVLEVDLLSLKGLKGEELEARISRQMILLQHEILSLIPRELYNTATVTYDGQALPPCSTLEDFRRLYAQHGGLYVSYAGEILRNWNKKPHSLDPNKIFDMLLDARTADQVTLHFKDGRVFHGALVFNQFKGSGRLINTDQELSVDFAIEDIRDLKF